MGLQHPQILVYEVCPATNPPRALRDDTHTYIVTATVISAAPALIKQVPANRYVDRKLEYYKGHCCLGHSFLSQGTSSALSTFSLNLHNSFIPGKLIVF